MLFTFAKTKAQISCVVTEQLISALILAPLRPIGKTGVMVSFFPSQFFPRGKNKLAHFYPGEETDFLPRGKKLTNQLFPHPVYIPPPPT